MKPTNTEPRRAAYMKFIGLFLLSVVPLCLLSYSFGSSDMNEVDQLRKLVSVQNESRSLQTLDVSAKQEVGNGIKELSGYITDFTLDPTKSAYADVKIKLEPIKSNIEQLSLKYMDGAEADYLDLTVDLLNVFQHFNEKIYQETASQMKVLDADYNDCIGRLSACQQSR